MSGRSRAEFPVSGRSRAAGNGYPGLGETSGTKGTPGEAPGTTTPPGGPVGSACPNIGGAPGARGTPGTRETPDRPAGDGYPSAEKNPGGATGSVYPTVRETPGGAVIAVPGREYTWSGTALPSSVKSRGEELLAAPMRLALTANGKSAEFLPATVMPTELTGEGKTVLCSAESELFYVNTSVTVEEDGCAFADVTLMPRGFTVRQVFGLDSGEYEGRRVDGFRLEIPVRKSAVKYYQVSPNTESLTGDFPGQPRPRELAFADFIPAGGFAASFTAQVMLLGDGAGLGVFFTTRKGWNIADGSRAIEVEETPDAYVIRVHFLDGPPKEWGDAWKDERARLMVPVTFRFGFAATPLREPARRPFTERAFHIDCFKKIEGDYEDFFGRPVVPGDGENGFDRLSRLGVKTLYLHEKWNDIQNSPVLTERTRRRLRCITDECHARGIKVIPYFGYELSSLSPYYARYGRELLRLSSPDTPTANSWNRVPAQRDIPVCENSRWAEIFVNGVERLLEEFGFDGLYLDTLTEGHSCGNTLHGCGHVEDGKVVESFPTDGVRRIIKELSRFVHKRGGVMCCHGYGSMTLPAIYYADYLWEGENFQSLFLHGRIRRMPEGHLRAFYSGEALGVPVYALCYNDPEVWPYGAAISMSLLHNSMPKPVDIGEPLEETSRIWDAYDAFPLEMARFVPYYSAENGVAVSDGSVKVSYYDAPGEILAVVAAVDADFSGAARVDFSPLGVTRLTDALTGETLGEAGRCEPVFSGFGYRLLRGVKG